LRVEGKMSRIPYYEVENATGKHAEFLGKLGTHMNIYRMLANSENGLKGFIRMGNALLYRCELDPVLRELAIMRVGRLSRAAYEVFQHERIGREAGVTEEKIAALRDATIEAPAFTDNEKAVLRFTDDVVRNVRASDKTLKPVEAILSRGALVELTLTIGYYMMVCRLLETTGVDGEDGQAEWLKTAKL
jgi:4-carboxymuconolactone decarboxylase